MNPEQLLYAKTHEWVHVETESEGGRIATVGISAFALEALTDLVFVELPEVGRQLQAGEAFGEIESVKAVSDLYCPVAGEVVEVNQSLPDQLETIGEDPHRGLNRTFVKYQVGPGYAGKNRLKWALYLPR